MNLSEISEERKLIMHSVYMADNKLTYARIAGMYQGLYPDLTADDVGRVIREREDSNEGIVPIEKENIMIKAIKRIVERNDINAMRKNIN